MAQLPIPYGAVANDPNTANDIANRTAWQRVQDNFTDLYAVQSRTVSAGDVRFASQPTTEAKITAAIAQAKVELAQFCIIPAFMLPFDPTLVTFDADVQMLREGGPQQSGLLDVVAYGAVADAATDNATAFAAVYGVATSGQTVSFSLGVYRTTLPLPIKTGVNQRGDGAIASTIKYVQNGVGTMFDDGNTAISTISENLLFVRVGDGTAVAGATQSARYTVRMRHASSIFRFNNCWFQDANWNFTAPVGDELTAFTIEDGSAYFLNCYTNVSGRVIYQPSGGGGTALTKYIGIIETTGIKCLAQHAGITHMVGSFEASGAGASACISCAGSEVNVSGLILRSGGVTVQGVFNAGATVYVGATIRSSGVGIRNESGALFVNGDVIGTSLGIVQTGGTVDLHGDIKTAAGDSFATAIDVSGGGVCHVLGNITCGGIGVTLDGATSVLDYAGRIDGEQGGAQLNGGTLVLNGRIVTSVNGITPAGTTAKVIDIGNLVIEITGANTARRGIIYGASTNTTATVGVLRIQVPAGAASSISTNGGNTQVITAGKILSNVAVGADITVSAFTYSAP